ncbi:MAG: hypothetical protein ACOH2J_04545 [Allorhizobium sp.]
MTVDEGIWRSHGLVFDRMEANVAAMRPLIRFILVVAALAYGFVPLASMAAATPSLQQGGHGDHMSAQKGDAMGNATSGDHCPRHTKPDINGHCAACLALPALLRLDNAKDFVGFVPLSARSTALVSNNAAPLLPPPRA